MKNLRDVLIHQLTDLFSAEQQLVETLPKMIEASSSLDLKKGFQFHLEETKDQVHRLELVAGTLHADLTMKASSVMQGLVREVETVIGFSYANKHLKDAMLASVAQKIEHYEIAAYGSVIALAEFLGYEEIADSLVEALEEEKTEDVELTEVSQIEIYPACERAQRSSGTEIHLGQ